MKVVVFLQNAWSPVYAGGTWSRKSWLRALERSRSGQRLRKITQCGDVWFDNTTPIVGATPSSIITPDAAHITKVILEQRPDVVVACGKQAAEALRGKFYPLLIVPHPAYRVVTNELWTEVYMLLAFGSVNGVVELKQGRGRIVRQVSTGTADTVRPTMRAWSRWTHRTP